MNSVAFVAVCEGCEKYLSCFAPETEQRDVYMEVDSLLHYALTGGTPWAMRYLCVGKCPECGGEFKIEKIGHVAGLGGIDVFGAAPGGSTPEGRMVLLQNEIGAMRSWINALTAERDGLKTLVGRGSELDRELVGQTIDEFSRDCRKALGRE